MVKLKIIAKGRTDIFGNNQPPSIKDLFIKELRFVLAPKYSKECYDPQFGPWSILQCSFQLRR